MREGTHSVRLVEILCLCLPSQAFTGPSPPLQKRADEQPVIREEGSQPRVGSPSPTGPAEAPLPEDTGMLAAHSAHSCLHR